MIKPIQTKEISSIFIASQDSMSESDYGSMLMIGTGNWEAYLLERPSCEIIQEAKDVLFLEFRSKDDLCAYVKSIPDATFIDFSYEHEVPCLLQFKYE